MSCNCGCHDDKAPATGWKRFVPLIVAAAVVGVLIAGAVLKKNDARQEARGTFRDAIGLGDAAGR
jgi:ligand-binding sensor protein